MTTTTTATPTNGTHGSNGSNGTTTTAAPKKPRAKKPAEAKLARPSAAQQLAALQTKLLAEDMQAVERLAPDLLDALAGLADNPRCPIDRDALAGLRYLLTAVSLECGAARSPSLAGANGNGWTEEVRDRQ